MSDFAIQQIHPKTGKLKHCVAIDNYFGPRIYGYRFPGEKRVYTEDEIKTTVPMKSYPDG